MESSAKSRLTDDWGIKSCLRYHKQLPGTRETGGKTEHVALLMQPASVAVYHLFTGHGPEESAAKNQ
jgi:hypothetical protein